MEPQTLRIKTLSHTGHGIAENGWQILGAFPHDVIRAKVYHQASGINYAEILEIVQASEFRSHKPLGAPFFSANAPWEHLDEAYENEAKRDIVVRLFKDISLIAMRPPLVPTTKETTHYRNKAAYSFMSRSGSLAFALYTRGSSGPTKIAQEDNILVHPAITRMAEHFLSFFRQKKVALDQIKYLVLRYSYTQKSIVAHILVPQTSRKKIPWKKESLEKFMNQQSKLAGVLVSHSEAGTRSSLATKDFYELGNISIREEILTHWYDYHPSQFFQIYPEAFAHILSDLYSQINALPDHQDYELLDLFSGVGLIGLHLADLVKSVHGVEQSSLAREYALKNAALNNTLNFQFTEANVDDAIDAIAYKQILILDPPRSGLGKTCLKAIRDKKPEYIFYISCNPETQAQDFNHLQDIYQVTGSRVYNIFPKTTHIEHMISLERKNTSE